MSRHKPRPGRWALLAAATLVSSSQVLAAGAFTFAAIGDVPYAQTQFESFGRLIRRINAAGPAFTLHVGDIKSGSARCDDDTYTHMLGLFNTFEKALVYTPGDNEWTDCHRADAGAYDPLERLDKVRSVFFAGPRSLGRAPLSLARQSSDPKYPKYVENARWRVNGVAFASVHIVGSNNNLQRDAGALREYAQRNAANMAWIASTFAEAARANSKAVVLFFQADPGWDLEGREDQRSGYTETLRVLKAQVRAFGKPVLLVHGDKHRFVVDKPLYQAKRLIYNATRLMVFGDAEVHGVLVTVDPDDADVFSFRALTVPGNLE